MNIKSLVVSVFVTIVSTSLFAEFPSRSGVFYSGSLGYSIPFYCNFNSDCDSMNGISPSIKVDAHTSPKTALFAELDGFALKFLSESGGDAFQEVNSYSVGLGIRYFLANYQSTYFETGFGFGKTQINVQNIIEENVEDVDYKDKSYRLNLGVGLEISDNFLIGINFTRLSMDINPTQYTYSSPFEYLGNDVLAIISLRAEVRL